MNDLRVVITGAGPVSGLGLGFDELTTGLRAGQSAIEEITLFDPEPYGRARGCEVRNFDVSDYVSSRQTYLDRSAELALAAMNLAISDAGLDMASLDRAETGLVMGSGWGCPDTSALFFVDVLEKGGRYAKPFLFPHTYSNTVISLIAMEYGLTGFHMNFASGAVASAQALVQAYDLVRTGRQHTVFAGGYESLSETRMAAETLRGRLSGGAGLTEVCAPFDSSRSGTILGEGAGMFVIEEFEHAKKRGARIRAEICGAWLASDIGAAMRQTGKSCNGAACVLAAANGSPELDRAEADGLSAVPGLVDGKIPVTAIKSVIGETDGAAGALHCAVALGMMESGYLPATQNLAEPEDKLLNFVRDAGRQADLSRVFVNALDRGGAAVCLVLESCI